MFLLASRSEGEVKLPAIDGKVMNKIDSTLGLLYQSIIPLLTFAKA